MSEFQDLPLLIEQIAKADDSEQIALLNESIEHGLESGSVALILEAFPVDDRVRLWRALPLEMHIDVLTDMRSEVRYSIITALSEVELKLTLAKLDNLSLIEWSDSLPEEIINEALSLIKKTNWNCSIWQTSMGMMSLAAGQSEKSSLFLSPFRLIVRSV